ncbi:hypothetical protein CSC12_1044 [Klebsiella michiganensis]|nr:hypothetical protein CSC12_1044 [Klebsiella michiganensis]
MSEIIPANVRDVPGGMIHIKQLHKKSLLSPFICYKCIFIAFL